MTGKDLLTAMSGIDGRYIEEAAPAAAPKTRSLRRPLLVAAAIAAALLLVGCGIVYALRLQDMSIGKASYTQRFDDKGKAIDPVEKSLDIITPYGRSGDAIQQALKEWYEFQESYDPDYLLATNEPDIPGIPNQYEYTYSCYTQEMVDKVNEIAAKYDLKLLEEWIPFQRYQSDIFLEETGIQSLLLPDSGAQITGMAGMLYPPYNFSMEFNLVTENAGTLMTSYGYARKDYFPRAFPGGMDIDAYEQWDHTTPGGTKLLLALNSKGQGEIIAEQENAMIMISIDGNRATSHSRLPGRQRGHDEGGTGIHRRSVRLFRPAEGSEQSRRRGKAGRSGGGLSGGAYLCSRNLRGLFRLSEEKYLYSLMKTNSTRSMT